MLLINIHLILKAASSSMEAGTPSISSQSMILPFTGEGSIQVIRGGDDDDGDDGGGDDDDDSDYDDDDDDC